MRVSAIANVVSKAMEDEGLRREILAGKLPGRFSAAERRAIEDTVLRIEKGEIVPKHLDRIEPLLIWLATYLPEPV